MRLEESSRTTWAIILEMNGLKKKPIAAAQILEASVIQFDKYLGSGSIVRKLLQKNC